MATGTDIARLTAVELVDRYRRGELSPVDATRAALDRITACDPEVNAYRTVAAEAAMEAAEESRRRWEVGTPIGPLDGVPTAIKDILLTRGWSTLRGSLLIDPDQDWAEDAPTVARLREAGAVFLGKTTTPELAWKGVTDSPLTGVTRNPWDTERTSGGSSGGSAAAVALGMGPLSVGTDGGGSVRIPASFCGIFALKPTYGQVPLYPASPFGTLAHAGPMTRTVDDAAVMMDVLAQPDSRDWSALPAPREPYVAALDRGVAGLRIAYSPRLGYAEVDPEVAALVADGVRVLAELGATVEEADPGFADPVEAFHVLWFSGAAKSVEQFPEHCHGELDPGLREICTSGRTMSAIDYLDATAVRMSLGRTMGAFHETYDLLVTPAMPIPAFAAGVEVPPGWPDPRWTSWATFSYPFNMTQQPAASLPCGSTAAGLPVGLQIVGPRHADALVLAASKALQDARPWPSTIA